MSSKKSILYKGQLYDVSDWVKRHPGGKVIDYYTEAGEDATLAIQQFHHRSVKKVTAIMKSFDHHPVKISETNMDPQTLQRHQELTEDFTKLYEEFEAEGLFQSSPAHVFWRLVEILGLLVFGIFLQGQDLILFKIFGCLVLAIFICRSGWLQHEAGHLSLTGKIKIDHCLQTVIMGIGIGMSASWYQSTHLRHHAMPQRMERDMDIHTLPLVAFNTKIVKDDYAQGKKFFIRHQATLYLAVDTCLAGWLWKLWLHPRYAIFKKKYFEIAIIVIHYILVYHWLDVWSYLLSFWLGMIFLFGNFTLSHSHMDVTTAPLHWLEYGLLMTTNVEPSWLVDWWMGYLNYQIEHHLFPTMPQFKLPATTGRLRALAEKHGMKYQCLSYWKAVEKSYINLVNVSKELQEIGDSDKLHKTK